MSSNAVIKHLEQIVADESIPRARRREWKTILDAARRLAGEPAIARGRPARISKDEIRERLARGETLTAIAEAVGCTPAYVSRFKTEP